MSESRINDLMGKNAVDFEERVDMRRLKEERLARLREQMRLADLGGMILFDPLNIRYATSVRSSGVAAIRMFFQYAVVPQTGEPKVFTADNADGSSALEKGVLWDYFPCGQYVEEASAEWGRRIKSLLAEMGIDKTRIGVDRLDFFSMTALQSQSITIADARIPIEKSRSIKTVDEVSLIRQSCAIADIACCAVRDAIEPGVTEDELFAIMTYENISRGGEHMDERLLATGTNSNPWNHLATDRMVRPGELIAFDTDMCGPFGYFADFSRTYLCGDGSPNDEQREAYKIAYEFIYESLEFFQPGAAFQEIAEKCPPLPEAYRYQRYPMIAHGDGMSDEWPCVYWPDQSWSGFGNDDDVLQENMVLSLEGLASKKGGRESVKLEEQILITEGGPEVLSMAPFDERFF
jgi:Xaa-Pro aminopeptidase